MTKPVGVGFLGSQFVSGIHARALGRNLNAKLVGVASPTPGNAEAFAETYGLPHHWTDHRPLLERDDIDMVVIGTPNDTHCPLVLDCAAAGKHVVLEKPMCLSMAEADSMVAACKDAGVLFMYAEEVCFAPKYVRMKSLLDAGALGRPTLVKQSEKHDGPHAPHFWDVDRAGGGVLADMGCHGIAFARWMLDRAPIVSVYAQLSTQVHGDKTRGEDNALLILEFENGCFFLNETAGPSPAVWTTGPRCTAPKAWPTPTCSTATPSRPTARSGYDYAVEKAARPRGGASTIYEEEWNYGFWAEFDHFVDCVQKGTEPLVTGEDARAVQEVLFAAYESARTGAKVALPFRSDAAKPWDLWQGGAG